MQNPSYTTLTDVAQQVGITGAKRAILIPDHILLFFQPDHQPAEMAFIHPRLPGKIPLGPIPAGMCQKPSDDPRALRREQVCRPPHLPGSVRAPLDPDAQSRGRNQPVARQIQPACACFFANLPPGTSHVRYRDHGNDILPAGRDTFLHLPDGKRDVPGRR